MQILFLALGLVGFIITIFGARWNFRSFQTKEIIGFSIIELEKEFVIKKPGLFTICIIGGGYLNNNDNFRILVKSKENQKVIDLKENCIKPRFRRNCKIGIEYRQFSISDSGIYKVEIENVKDLIVKKSMLKTKQIFQSPLPIKNIEVLIKETIPISKKLLGIVFFILGLNMFFWGIILGVTPELFG